MLFNNSRYVSRWTFVRCCECLGRAMVRLVFGDADMNAVETSVAGSRVPIVTRSDPGAGCGIVTRERDRNGMPNCSGAPHMSEA